MIKRRENEVISLPVMQFFNEEGIKKSVKAGVYGNIILFLRHKDLSQMLFTVETVYSSDCFSNIFKKSLFYVLSYVITLTCSMICLLLSVCYLALEITYVFYYFVKNGISVN